MRRRPHAAATATHDRRGSDPPASAAGRISATARPSAAAPTCASTTLCSVGIARARRPSDARAAGAGAPAAGLVGTSDLATVRTVEQPASG